jgi:uncharacterized membrane protein YtjA (UPF0391 family)
MRLSWSDIAASIALLAALAGFTFTGPGTAKQVAQAVFYIFTVVFFVSLFRRVWRRPKPL